MPNYNKGLGVAVYPDPQYNNNWQEWAVQMKYALEGKELREPVSPALRGVQVSNFTTTTTYDVNADPYETFRDMMCTVVQALIDAGYLDGSS